MNPNLIPAPDAAGMPGPAWLFHILLVFTFFLHLLFMNLTLGGTLMAWVSHLFAGGRSEDPRSVLATRLMAVNNYGISLTITTGVAPLLFIQVLYHQFFYTATILIAAGWFGLLVLLTLGYYAAYLFKFRGTPATGRGGGFWLAISALCFLAIAAIQVAVNLIHSQVETWSAVAANPWVVLGDPTFVPRLLHFVLAGLGFAAALSAWWAGRRAAAGDMVELNQAVARHAWKWVLWTTVAQIGDGFVLLMVLPRPVLLGLMKGGAATMAPLTIAILFAIGLLMMVARAKDPVQEPRLVSGVMWTLLALVALMSVTRHQLRLLYLDPVLSKATLAELPQWGTFTLFAVILVLGLATTGWMVWRVMQSRATGEAAA